ncbi:hypothetical protein MKW98_026705 [Papaver atlanticum]|uniref:DUF3444 domain-containing protein n=1 Tax=Papaver atlanticum TaxID=357466 RepID=A0AAD4S087_9MAGN|nr:hypothetical protein MKW98_026705 [Papaver atlanticum]
MSTSSQTQSSPFSSSTFSFGTATSTSSSSSQFSSTPSSTVLSFCITAAFGSSAGPSTNLCSLGSQQPSTPSNNLFGFSSFGVTSASTTTTPAFGFRITAAPAGGGSSLSGSTFSAIAVSNAAPTFSIPSFGAAPSTLSALSNAALAFAMPSFGAPTAASITQTTDPASVAPAATSSSTTTSSNFSFRTPSSSPFGSKPASAAATTNAVSAGALSSPALAKPMSSASTVTTTGPVLSASTATGTPATFPSPVKNAIPATTTTSPVTTDLLSRPAPASTAQGLFSSQAATSAGSAPSITTPSIYNFGRNKSEASFKVDQMWAIFDDLDFMPRKYVRINKLYSPFKVDVTWLEFIAEDINETAWKRSGLPVACGKFRYNKSQKTDTIKDMSSFSHMIREKYVNEDYNIHPRKGETWALYKNWNIKWSSHREYEYEFVEIVTDYTNKYGIVVTHLVKLKGFVCLFKPNGMTFFQIPSNEMLRFSHWVPSFRTNGREREDGPEGYFELDTSSLPSNLEELSGVIDVEADTVDCNINGANKFSRMSNGCYKNPNEEKRAAEAYNQTDKSKATSVSVSEKNAAACAKEFNPDGVITIPDSDEDIPSSPSSLRIFETPDTEIFNFDRERSCEKFKISQIWALYCKLDKLPKSYAQIESVTSFPVFKLSVKWLKPCDPPRRIFPWVDKEMPVSCGTFKVTSSEVVVFSDSISFSHQLTGVPTVNNIYTILPRAGEVWALYSKFCSELTCSDLKKCEYNIVEILEVVDVHWIIVSVLERVAGFKTVFKAKEKEGLDSTAAIPWIELYRFSHQVPTFMISGARYGKLRGCWELDPRSLAAFDRPLDKSKATSVSDSEKNVVAPTKKISLDGVIAVLGNVDEDISSSPSSLKNFEMPGTKFCNFDLVRSREKFKTGQVWALYCKLDKLPKNYALIESIKPFPVFELSIKWLKPCDPPRCIIPWVDREMPVSCGTFKVASSEVVVFNNSISFSHQLSEIPAVNNAYTIHPRAGEVWAVYGTFRSDLMCSDLKKCEYAIVEILEVVDVHWIIVSVLQRVAAFKTIFKAKEKEGLDSTVAIPVLELYRFSHQVPSFILSGARFYPVPQSIPEDEPFIKVDKLQSTFQFSPVGECHFKHRIASPSDERATNWV